MANLVPEFISVLRDIRDVKYPLIVEDTAIVVAKEALMNSHYTAIDGVYAINTAVTNVNANATNINAVNANSTNINTNATNVASINTNATNIANINTNATNIANVNTVATDLNLNASSNTKIVATAIANINAVGTNIAKVDTVSTNIAKVSTVSTDLDLGASSKIKIVSDAIANVNTVTTNIASVNTNATNINSINTNATNIVAIQNASANANSALASKNSADADVVLTHADVVLTHADVITCTAKAVIANQILNMTAGASTLTAGSPASASFNPTTGVMTFGIPTGPTGAKGDPFVINAIGLASGKSAYDAQPIGFSYFATDTALIYFKMSGASGNWSTGVTFGKGDDGDAGNGIVSITLTGTVGSVDTYRMLFTDATFFDYTVTNSSVLSVQGRTGTVIINASDVGLANVNNTSDANKPVSTATQTALNLKADLISPTFTTPNIGTASGASFNSITGLATVAPVVNGTATVGVSTLVARQDHVHPTDTGTVTSVTGTTPVVSSGGTTPVISMAAATALVDGYMTSTYASKLDGIDTGAQVNVGTDLTATAGTTAGPTINSSTGSDVVIPSASGTTAGIVTTGAQTFAGAKTMTSPVLITPTLGTPVSGTLTNCTFPTLNQNTTGSASTLTTARTINGVSFNGSANIEVGGRLGANIASATTTTIGTAGSGETIHITGATTIASLGPATTGTRRTLIFDDTLTVTHNATSLILFGAVSITTAPGDIAEFVCESGPNGYWRCTDYQRFSGKALTPEASTPSNGGVGSYCIAAGSTYPTLYASYAGSTLSTTSSLTSGQIMGVSGAVVGTWQFLGGFTTPVGASNSLGLYQRII